MTRPGRVLDEPPASARENLAVDEAIYQCMTSKQFPVTLRFWRNTGSAILGRSQAARDEVHEDACALHGVEIARRFSGGGTVYMDKGTLVVSFFVQKSLLPGGIPVQSVNDLFSRLLVSSLERASGSKFTTRDTTSIFHDGCKISGGAGHHDATRVLHHATVLVHADLEVLASVLVACEHVPLTAGGSKWAPTKNITWLDTGDWKSALVQQTGALFRIEMAEGTLINEETTRARSLFENKYSADCWTREGRAWQVE